jgi:hypothetical protein
MSRTTFTCVWNPNIKFPKLACQQFLRSAQDQAINCTMTGILPFCMTEAEHLVLYPLGPRVVLGNPGAMPAGNARHVWEHLNTAYELQEFTRRAFFSHLTSPAAGIPLDIIRSMEDGPHGLSTRSLQWIFTFLQNFCVLTFADIDEIKLHFTEAWDQVQEIRTFIHDKQHLLRLLAANHCTMNNHDVYGYTKKWFHVTHWAQCWNEHFRTHQTLALLNVEHLFRDIIVFKETSLQHMTAAQAGYHAAAVFPQATIEDTIAIAVAAAMANYKPKSYCWSCGETSNPRHTSASCNKQKPGHQKKATIQNRMGGH